MSTKTTFKRVALVAVASLGFGVLTSVAPASAAAGTASLASVTAGAVTNVHSSGRTGVAVTATVTWTASTDAADNETVNTAVAFVNKPATSTATVSQAVTAISQVDGISGGLFTINAAGGGGSALSTITFTPDVAGTYSIVSWNDRNDDGSISNGEAFSSKDYTVVAGSDAVGVALTQYNSTAATGATGNGALVKVTITNSAGAYASLGALETLTATVSSGVVYKVNDSTSNAGTASITLNRASFDAKGRAWLNLTNGTDGAVQVLTIAGGTGAALAGVNKTVSTTFKDAVGAIDATVTPYNTTGVKVATAHVYNSTPGSATAGVWQVDTAKTTGVVAALSSTTGALLTVTVTDSAGLITGLANADYDAVSTAGTTGTFDVNFSAPSVTPLANATLYVIKLPGSGTLGNNTITVNSVAAVDAAANTVLDQATAVRGTAAGSVTLSAVIKNQFLVAMPNVAVAISVTGRNAQVVTKNAVSDADGRVSITYTDAPLTGVTALTDTVTFDQPNGTDKTVTVNWGTLAVSAVKLTGGNTTAGVANATIVPVDINAGDGAESGAVSYTAKVTDASGSVIVGAPVSFSISGTGAAITSTTKTVYTGNTGVATASVYGWIAGTYTVTATSGGVSGTGTITFANTTGSDQRVLSATVNGPVVVAHVVDRFGNPVKNVTVYATKTGAGYFGTGLSTASGATNASGDIEFSLAGGEATVTVSTLDPAAAPGTNASGQTCALAGNLTCASGATAAVAFTATTAGTATLDEAGVGASFAPAGVSSVTVTVGASDSAAQAAADAAAEATDAANAATDAANAAAEAADAATAAAQDAADAVAALSTQVTEMVSALKKQITALTNLVIKIQKKVRA